MPESLVSLLVQIPLVAVFIWFVLEMDKRQRQEQQHRDEQWRGFLKEQRDAGNQAIGRLAEDIKKNTEQLSSLTTVIVEHDRRAQTYIEREEVRER